MKIHPMENTNTLGRPAAAMYGMRLVHQATALVLSLLLLFAFVQRAAAIEIQKVTSPAGITAWLVEDYTVPLVSMSVEFTGGSSTDPAGKEGLTSIMTAMMDEGAGELDTAALKAELEALGIEIGFSAGRDSVTGGMRLVRSDIDRAFELFAMMLNSPRFEADSLERIRSAYLAAHKRTLTNPSAIMGRAVREALFDGHPYARATRGDTISLAAISRDDIITHHRNLMSRENLFIGVVGAIDAETLGEKLDAVFAELPDNGNLTKIADTEPASDFRSHIEFESPQTLVSLTLPGKKRADPDFFAAFLANHILGGGGFSSRLYDEIREKRGLTYGISSSIVPRDHAAYIYAGFSTRADQTTQALELLLSEIGKMAEEGPSPEELEAAKKYVIGSYAINNLDTSGKIADVLVGLQSSGLGKTYIDDRVGAINSVTLEDVRRVAREMLSVEPVIITVGPGDS